MGCAAEPFAGIFLGAATGMEKQPPSYGIQKSGWNYTLCAESITVIVAEYTYIRANNPRNLCRYMTKQLLSLVLSTGLLVGLADGMAASLHFYFASGGKSPALVFQYIASGLVGPKAYSMGGSSVVMGIALHFVVALSVTAVFLIAYPYLRILDVNALVLGGIFGVAVWAVMQYGVLPLSQVQLRPFNLVNASIGILIHIFVIGVPLGWAARHYLK